MWYTQNQVLHKTSIAFQCTPRSVVTKITVCSCIANAAIWIGYATHYLFVNRYGVAASNMTKQSFSQKNNAYLWNEIVNTSLF